MKLEGQRRSLATPLGNAGQGDLDSGDNRRVDLSQTVIFMTSNLGGGKSQS